MARANPSMVAPMNDTSQPDPLEPIRREIDRVDDSMLALAAERLRLIDQMAGAKPVSGLPIRPGREIAMLRRLIASASAPLERELVVELWRALIAAGLRRQRVIDVFVGGGRGDPSHLYDVARQHFGARARIQHLAEPQAAMLRAADEPNKSVAVTPWPAAPGGAWWPALSERRFHGLHLIAGLPLVGPANDFPEACVFAAARPEPAGGDVSMLLAFDPHHRLQRALQDAGLDGREIARAEPRVLVRVEGFVALDDDRAAALTNKGLDNVRVLGSYARI